MARSGVKLNHAGMAALLKSAEIRAAVAPHAEQALAAAQAGAPVESGDYKASLHIEHDTTDRAVERVVADVDYAMVVEAKTGNLARSLS
jgi:hypothetical protein